MVGEGQVAMVLLVLGIVVRAFEIMVGEETEETFVRTLAQVFGEAHPLYGPVPLYPSGSWSWTYAINGSGAASARFAIDSERALRIEAQAKYWNRDIHRGAFAVPNHIKQALA